MGGSRDDSQVQTNEQGKGKLARAGPSRWGGNYFAKLASAVSRSGEISKTLLRLNVVKTS